MPGHSGEKENFTTSIVGGFSLGGFPFTNFTRISTPDFWRFFGESVSQLSLQKPLYDFLESGNMIKHIVFIGYDNNICLK